MLNIVKNLLYLQNETANVTSFESISVGQQVIGWVAAIRECGLIMNFTNGIKVTTCSWNKLFSPIERLEKKTFHSFLKTNIVFSAML